MTAEPSHVPTVTVDFDDLAELILAVHTVVTDVPRRLRRRHDNVVDIVAATVSDIRPTDAGRRHRLLRTPAAAFAVTQRGETIDVVVEQGDAVACASFFDQTPAAHTDFAAWLAEHTHDALRDRHIHSILS
ncbi:hypothetical protein J2W56_003852 [Nocardia kruczakiae]|uniref:Uncharacterized protein n=1 Tax=Nocardia kruczakiae TaxID=261477 RepID=A0ABU1XHS3_9NOCA|nr:hypothetical protein [Nocardia kruczakiae]MDR7170101.1 hypothetical protein [Nocardia kruczakiae]